MERNIVYLNNGKLFIVDKDRKEEIVSDFGQQVINNTVSIAKRNEWKTSGKGAQFMGMATWSQDQVDPASYIIRVNGVCSSSKERKMIYSISTESVGGLFEYDLVKKKEKRLYHGNNFSVKNLTRNRKDGRLLCSQTSGNGISNIAIIEKDYVTINEITEGDSVDSCPAWHPLDKDKIVFQSSGVARNSNGVFAGLGPALIEEMNLKTGDIHTILSNENFDYLTPRYDSRGRLYAIRRPYNQKSQIRNIFSTMKDTLYFPFRLVSALFHYLDFFSRTYSNKPLVTSRGTPKEGPDQKYLFLKGRMVELKNEKGNVREEGGSLVDKNWKLVCIDSQDGLEKILAESVLSFDISDDDSIIFTDGRTLHRLDSGNHARIFRDHIIEDVFFI